MTALQRAHQLLQLLELDQLSHTLRRVAAITAPEKLLPRGLDGVCGIRVDLFDQQAERRRACRLCVDRVDEGAQAVGCAQAVGTGKVDERSGGVTHSAVRAGLTSEERRRAAWGRLMQVHHEGGGAERAVAGRVVAGADDAQVARERRCTAHCRRELRRELLQLVTHQRDCRVTLGLIGCGHAAPAPSDLVLPLGLVLGQRLWRGQVRARRHHVIAIDEHD